MESWGIAFVNYCSSISLEACKSYMVEGNTLLFPFVNLELKTMNNIYKELKQY